MPVSITWSSTNGGMSLSSIDHGSGANNNILSDQIVYIRHDGINDITNCKLFIGSKDPYTGNFSAAEDLNTLLAWGDGPTSNNFGGLQINQDAINSWAEPWPTYLSKGTVSSLSTSFRTNIGELDSGINLHVNTGASSTGVIPASSTPNVRFKLRMAIPNNVSKIGTKEFAVKIRYTYTS